MDSDHFWQLMDHARAEAADDDGDGEAVAAWAVELLAAMPVEEIVATQQVLWDQLAVSYTAPLWAAAYVMNGGCSDDGFEYFRGWLITQGRAAFDQALADPETLADLPAVRAAAAGFRELECESTLSIVWNAYESVTGEKLPSDAWSIRYPDLGGEFWFDFDDRDRLTRKLPRLSALYAHWYGSD